MSGVKIETPFIVEKFRKAKFCCQRVKTMLGKNKKRVNMRMTHYVKAEMGGVGSSQVVIARLFAVILTSIAC